MEIGRIKWAGHYNSVTDDFNNYGYITRLINQKDIYFNRRDVLKYSKLTQMFDNSDDSYVVFDVVPSPRKSGEFNAVNVQFLEEVSPDALKQSLSEESLSSSCVRKAILDVCPDVLLGNDPIQYFPLLGIAKIKDCFVMKYGLGQFGGGIAVSIAKYFRSGRRVIWNKDNWKLIKWSEEPEKDIKEVCLSAEEAGIDISPLCIIMPKLWRNDAVLAAKLPREVIEAMLLSKEYSYSKEDFRYLMTCVQNTEIKALLCDEAQPEWFYTFPDCIRYLSEKKIAHIFRVVNWGVESPDRIKKIIPFLTQVRNVSDVRMEKALAAAAEKARITEDSPLWNVLSDAVRKLILQDYREAGFITASNATVNPGLDRFLNQYYRGEQKRAFSIQQKEAIQSVNGTTLLFAVPGSGKTTVIVARAGYMVHALNIEPQHHLVMTFNKAAAAEMEARYHAIYTDDKNTPVFRTIHSFCYKIICLFYSDKKCLPVLLKNSEEQNDPRNLQQRKRNIAAAILGTNRDCPETAKAIRLLDEKNEGHISSDRAKEIECYPGMTLEQFSEAWKKKDIDQNTILRDILGKKAYDEDSNTTLEAICPLISFIKNRMLTDKEIGQLTYKDGKQEKPIEPIYKDYKAYLTKENLMDFDDMLSHAYNILKDHPDTLARYQDKYPYVSLDEVQDTSLLQHRIVELLVKKSGNLFMVGDDDQSIYAFRGADPKEMLDFRSRYPQGKKLLMSTNYRSDIDIVRSADHFIRANHKREDKLMLPSGTEPGKIQIVLIPNLTAQYEYIAGAASDCSINKNKHDDLAILFRWNISALPVMAYLYKNQIPFFCSSKKETISLFFKQDAKRIILLLKYSINLNDFPTFQNAIHICYRSIINKEKDLDGILREWHENQQQSIADAVIRYMDSNGMSNKIPAFQSAYEKVKAIGASSPRSAISQIINQNEYGIFGQNGDSVNTWMRIYALLSIGSFYDSIDTFLQTICDMQKPEFGSQHTSGGKKVLLSTMHSAKGAEFNRVIIIDALDDITPGPAIGNDVWYDPEEERRLFYVAVTRAKKELDILQVDIYHDRHQKPSRFIGDLHAANKNIEVVNYDDGKPRSMLRYKMPHYVVREGKYTGIYSNDDDVDKIKKKEPTLKIERKESYADAIVYMHKGDLQLKREPLCVPQDLPPELSQRIWSLFGVSGIDGLSQQQLNSIRQKNGMFINTGETDYSNRAEVYALLYLPVNIYKIWDPLIYMLPTGRLPVDGTVRILEAGAGPGTATLGILQFYCKLARLNPGRQFKIEYYVIEREQAFIHVFTQLVECAFPENLSVNIHNPICADVNDAVKQFAGKDLDLILECNMLNPNEHVQLQQLTDLVNNICKALRNYGSFLMIEPQGPEMMTHLRDIVKNANKTDSLLHEVHTCEYKSIDLSHMQIVQDVIRKGIRTKAIDSHGYSYALFERKDVEVRTR